LQNVWSELLKYNKITVEFLHKRQKIDLAKGVENFDIKEWDDKQKEELRKHLLKRLGEERKTISPGEIVITAEVLPHNDPRYATIGDDTACCMPFGSGKQNVYMFGPQCGALTLSFKKPGSGEQRIAVQSILTLNKGFGKEQFAKVVDKMKNGDDVSLPEDLGKDFLENFYQSQPVIACDNVEGHKTYIKYLLDNDSDIISRIYRDFFEEYKRANSDFKNSPVVIGQGYSDYLTNLEEIDNEYLPEALISYSDNLGDKTLSLLKGEKGKEEEIKTGIQELTWHDTWPTSYLEEKVYKEENTDLSEGLTTIQKILTAGELQAKKEGTALLNVGNFDKKGKLQGYILGYIAKEYRSSEQKVYLHDAVVDKDARGKGMATELFMEILKRIQGDKKLSNTPIAMRTREKTSYPIIKKNIKKVGYRIIKDEEIESDGEIFHRIELEKI